MGVRVRLSVRVQVRVRVRMRVRMRVRVRVRERVRGRVRMGMLSRLVCFFVIGYTAALDLVDEEEGVLPAVSAHHLRSDQIDGSTYHCDWPLPQVASNDTMYF